MGGEILKGQLAYDNNGQIVDKLDFLIKTAIEIIQMFEPEEGYYVAFSGGKDSQVIYDLVKRAGVKHEAHYHITTVDPPELTKFIKQHYPEVIRDKPDINMYDLIVKKKTPPTRKIRYCCEHFKENGGVGRYVITGVRKHESTKRSKRKGVEYFSKSKSKKVIELQQKIMLSNDNDEKRKLVEHCISKGKVSIQPIIEWTSGDVWNYIEKYIGHYCKVYDEGFERIGCIGCPMAGRGRLLEFERWSYAFLQYYKSFERLLHNRGGDFNGFSTTHEIMAWWLEMKYVDYMKWYYEKIKII